MNLYLFFSLAVAAIVLPIAAQAQTKYMVASRLDRSQSSGDARCGDVDRKSVIEVWPSYIRVLPAYNTVQSFTMPIAAGRVPGQPTPLRDTAVQSSSRGRLTVYGELTAAGAPNISIKSDVLGCVWHVQVF